MAPANYPLDPVMYISLQPVLHTTSQPVDRQCAHITQLQRSVLHRDLLRHMSLCSHTTDNLSIQRVHLSDHHFLQRECTRQPQCRRKRLLLHQTISRNLPKKT